MADDLEEDSAMQVDGKPAVETAAAPAVAAAPAEGAGADAAGPAQPPPEAAAAAGSDPAPPGPASTQAADTAAATAASADGQLAQTAEDVGAAAAGSDVKMEDAAAAAAAPGAAADGAGVPAAAPSSATAAAADVPSASVKEEELPAAAPAPAPAPKPAGRTVPQVRTVLRSEWQILIYLNIGSVSRTPGCPQAHTSRRPLLFDRIELLFLFALHVKPGGLSNRWACAAAAAAAAQVVLHLLRSHYFSLLELHLAGPLSQASALQLQLLPPLLPGISRPLQPAKGHGSEPGAALELGLQRTLLPCSVRELCEGMAKGLDVRLGTAVQFLAYTAEEVKVTTVTGGYARYVCCCWQGTPACRAMTAAASGSH